MTDLINGKIEFFGYEINQNTTLQEFEKTIGNKFTKELLDDDIVNFYMNKEVGVVGASNFVENDTRFVYELYDMKFINVVIIFADDKIWQIQLITNMVSFTDDADGKRHYSDEKVNSRLKIMNDWTIKVLGKSLSKISSPSSLWYEYEWGIIQPSPWGYSGNSKLYIKYKK